MVGYGADVETGDMVGGGIGWGSCGTTSALGAGANGKDGYSLRSGGDSSDTSDFPVDVD
jgi:hypothetical protein